MKLITLKEEGSSFPFSDECTYTNHYNIKNNLVG